jgi:hypothetical protein
MELGDRSLRQTQPKPAWKLSDIRAGFAMSGLFIKIFPATHRPRLLRGADVLSEGDGVVFRGANGPWKKGDFDYHLNAQPRQTQSGRF